MEDKILQEVGFIGSARAVRESTIEQRKRMLEQYARELDNYIADMICEASDNGDMKVRLCPYDLIEERGFSAVHPSYPEFKELMAAVVEELQEWGYDVYVEKSWYYPKGENGSLQPNYQYIDLSWEDAE